MWLFYHLAYATITLLEIESFPFSVFTEIIHTIVYPNKADLTDLYLIFLTGQGSQRINSSTLYTLHNKESKTFWS